MNPVIIIPTYCSGNRHRESSDVLTTYDHMTPIANVGELPRCLASLRDNNIKTPIILLVVAQKGYEADASVKIKSLAASYPELDLRVAASEELNLFNNRTEQMGIAQITKGVSLGSYGAIRNFGLVLALLGGFDAAIFIDDDEVIENEGFVERACYGLGRLSPSGIPILAKTGYFVDERGRMGFEKDTHWYNRLWRMDENLNAWLNQAMTGSRLTRSNAAFGGCLAIHREAFKRISFDPYITRGEDTDYLINMRLYGSEVWFDNQWRVKHMPPKGGSETKRFRQDIYRWLYETRKIEYSKMQIDLMQIAPGSLDPYPGNFIGADVGRRIFWTALFRALAIKEHRKDYLRAARVSRKEASEYAMENCSKYYDFQYLWPEACSLMENDAALRKIFSGPGQYGDRLGLTGTFNAVSSSQSRNTSSFQRVRSDHDGLDLDLDLDLV